MNLTKMGIGYGAHKEKEMAKFNPARIADEEVKIVSDGMELNMKIPSKTFSTGKEGFFKQGIYVAPDGTKYRLNLQAYRVDPK